MYSVVENPRDSTTLYIMLAQADAFEFDWIVFSLLLFLLFVSLVTFIILLKRATTHRHWLDLVEWARSQKFQIQRHPQSIPEPLNKFTDLSPFPQVILSDAKNKLVRFQSAFSDDHLIYHALIRQIETEWPPTALRPADASLSLVDHYPLDLHPNLTSVRFQVKGDSISAARAIAASSERALLPPDLGLMLMGRSLIIDFSSRPFDPIEFMRLVELVDQLVMHLPAQKPN